MTTRPTNAPARGDAVRTAALLVHRYVGLAIATFLLVAGLTGSIIAFHQQIDGAIHPALLRVTPPYPGAAMMDPFALRERLQVQLDHDEPLHGVILERAPDRAVNYWVDGREVFVDPYTGKVLGARTWADLSEGMINIIPFIYHFHFSLGLGEVGSVLFGCVALLWTIDCFVGAYLTFPRRSADGRTRKRSWLARWLPAWRVKSQSLFSLVFTWHRASGLWIWSMLLVFAWSAVGLNLHEPVYEPVMASVFGRAPEVHDRLPQFSAPRTQPALSLRAARDVGRALMAEEGRRRGFDVLGERSIVYEPEHGAYGYTVESTLDPSERLAETTIYFDGDDGRALGFSALTGQHAGRTVSSWLIALHFGSLRAGGLVYRCFVCAMGLVVAVLSVTGVWIWWKRRRPGGGAKRSLSIKNGRS